MFIDTMSNKERKCGVDTKCIFFSVIKKTERYSLYIVMYVCRHLNGIFQRLLAAVALGGRLMLTQRSF